MIEEKKSNLGRNFPHCERDGKLQHQKILLGPSTKKPLLHLNSDIKNKIHPLQNYPLPNL